MALFSIPTSSSFTWYTLPIKLTGIPYVLELRYNTRMQRWVLSILDQANSPLLLSIPLLINRDLTTQYAALGIVQGTLFCADTTGAALEPVLSSFLTSHELFYVDQQA